MSIRALMLALGTLACTAPALAAPPKTGRPVRLRSTAVLERTYRAAKRIEKREPTSAAGFRAARLAYAVDKELESRSWPWPHR